MYCHLDFSGGTSTSNPFKTSQPSALDSTSFSSWPQSPVLPRNSSSLLYCEKSRIPTLRSEVIMNNVEVLEPLKPQESSQQMVWDLVVWDLNRGTPKESNPFHFPGFQESKPPGLLEKKHTSENWIWCTESLNCHVYIILEKISWSCLPPKMINNHESQSLSRWTCQQQKDMAITFVGALQCEPLRPTRSRSKSPWKRYVFWKLLKCIVHVQ